MNKIIPFLLVFIFAFTVAIAQQKIDKPDGTTITAYAVDSIISRLMDAGEVTGLCAGIVNNNKVVYVKSYGFKNKSLQTKNDTATSFYAASLAKPLFAYLVMQLADEGKINLDTPLYKYLPKSLPEYDNYKDLAGDDRWKLITARNCLDHTTGFPNWRSINSNDNQKLEIFFTPGKRYAYSGEGLYLLQKVVETITGRQLEELAQEKIFKPFGMYQTSFLWQPAFENDYAVGHSMSEDTFPKYRNNEANAAGSMETTIGDYTRFITDVLEGKRLSEKGRREMFLPQIMIYSKHQFPSLDTTTTDENKNIQLSYGLGWGLFQSAYGKAFFKEGHGQGYQHYTIGFPDKKMAVVIMTNSDNGESIFKELTEKITGVVIPWEWEGYFPYRPVMKLLKPAMEPFTGVYDGKLKAIITLVNGQLKVQSPTVNLPLTNLYAANDHHFFLKVMDVEIEFVKDKDGKIEKAVLDDEGEHYELKKMQ